MKIEFDSKIDSMIKREKFEKYNKQNHKFVINIEDLDDKINRSKCSIEKSKRDGPSTSAERFKIESLVLNEPMPVLAAFVGKTTLRSSTLHSPTKLNKAKFEANNNDDDYQPNYLHPTKPYYYYHTGKNGEEKRNFGKSNTGSDRRMPGRDKR
jgi:hypothetical protein